MWAVNINEVLFNEINHKADETERYVYVPATMENASPRAAALPQRRSITPLVPRSANLLACRATKVFTFPVGIGDAYNQ